VVAAQALLLHLVATENAKVKKIVVLSCRIAFRERGQAANGIFDGILGLRSAAQPVRVVGEVGEFGEFGVDQIP
jgi:hypothetical protein